MQLFVWVIAFVGVAAYFFLLGAQLVGLVQVFCYIGAVAVLIVFTILLTRREITPLASTGAVLALAVFSSLHNFENEITRDSGHRKSNRSP